MSEQELREGLRSAVEDEPPMRVDLDEIVSMAERLVRRRRALVAVGVGTAAVTLAAVTVPVVLGIARGEPAELTVAAPPAATSTQPTGSVEQLTQRGKDMQSYLTTRFPAMVPGVTQIDVRPFGGEAEGQIFAGQKYLSGTVRYVMHGTKTGVIVEIHAADDPAKVSKDCPGCDVRIQPDQSTVVLETLQSADMIIAKHFRRDGSVVTVNTYGHDPAGEPAPGSAAKLTLDQLVSLATDPELHL
ncbi:hypothetical protein [Actinocrispum sp. NPDC049592]|uniref:hypothetical protein n=1 Tax=Actinocrispum sp. NPDC049592 TaxID=3154835 RepID=UPI003445E63B